MCRVLDVSKSGYYAWIKRPICLRSMANAGLVAEMKQAYLESRKTYGSPRVHIALQQKDVLCGHNRIARLMRENGIVSRCYRRKCFVNTRHSRCDEQNLVNRHFDVQEPNRIWAADITCLWTGSGWLYLAVVMDLYSRKIIGWAMRSRITEDITIDALEMAVSNRSPKESLIHHSDQGSQYSSHAFRSRLELHGFKWSMSYKGDCYDNAVIESFFKTLKAELMGGIRFKSREEARSSLFEFIEVFYNKKRLHSTLGYHSPVEYERIALTKPSVH